MKLLLSNGAAAGEERQGAEGSAGGEPRTVVVGVKLDQQSRELLTWVLVKIAEPGDRVIALHVLGNNDIVDPNGQSSLLSLVRIFDSILAVYDGFCNLKQVDLKLKICRGSSIRKILVREAKLYSAAKVIVGVMQSHGPIGSPTSVAKYCAKKLPKDCWVLAVNNGRIIYQREGSPAQVCISQGLIKDHRNRPNHLFNVFRRSASQNSKVLSEGEGEPNLTDKPEKVHFVDQTLEQELIEETAFDSKETGVLKPKCSSTCAANTQRDVPSEEQEKSALAVVSSSSVSTPNQELRGRSPGWPLLRRAVEAEHKPLKKSSARNISVVQWAMGLPDRRCLSLSFSLDDQKWVNLKNDTLVLVGSDSAAITPFDESNLRSLPKELRGLHEKHSSTCRLFKYQELVAATSNFLEENLIGKGGSSLVYKGCLGDGKKIAVKILKQSEDVLKEFTLEIEIITELNHRNIISLLGFCFDANHLLLVYHLLARGSLEENLHGSRSDPTAFGWGERYKVALGVADALAYLHSRVDCPVVHRDVKSSNILLSNEFEPQLSDFGLSLWASSSSTHITCTEVAGTFGYLAPEYFMYGKVNDKVDVYAFGVVILELLSGRKPICSDFPKGQESLVMWAMPMLNSGKLSELLDPSLSKEYDHNQMEMMVLAATLCIRRAPRARPPMSLVSPNFCKILESNASYQLVVLLQWVQVLKLLQGNEDTVNWARKQVSSSSSDKSNLLLLLEDEESTKSSIQSHLNLAFHGVEEDSLSVGMVEQNVTLEDYLQGRWSRSSSFD
ncbi:hypothetical protein SAY87_026380 [Trapa incisa]|uniref:Protein kinase domain-containing protein n=1 Tax=Trapa incisa TaxID=236973 RepID=A0AAN7GM05_9MYRT|nr:hypothetical protein SAY87_026380 [Trapa incisa]